MSQLRTVAYYTNTSYFYTANSFMTFISVFFGNYWHLPALFYMAGADLSIYSKEEKHIVLWGLVSL